MLINIRVTPGAAESPGVEVPRAFMLIGEGGPNVLGGGQVGDVPWVVEAEGVRLRGGAVYAWCYAGRCCASPRYWPSVDAVADFHGCLILYGDGIVRTPRNEASRDEVPGDAVPGDVPEAG